MSTRLAMDWEVFYARFREPDFVPGYEIHNRLGGGAFGEVYKARKASIGKSYAIKFLKIDGEDQRDAAMRELEQVRHFAALDHPNLVSIEDMGEAAGVPYLIMGYAGEDTLARRLKQGALDEATALLYFVQVCRGVLALHDRRLVHFDLKPSNVFLKGDVARVGDYGLSKMMTDGRSTLSFGRGTPQYMAPEMLKNRADHRADIYSLGVMLYECLTAKIPYEAVVPGAFHVREDDRPPPFPANVPARLKPLVIGCLRLRPEDRFASVADVLTALGHTARIGDSARIPPQPAGGPVQPQRPPSSAETPLARSEARQTAAELTRGAVEVARGVWDGLRTTAPTPVPPRAGSGSASTPNAAASSSNVPAKPASGAGTPTPAAGFPADPSAPAWRADGAGAAEVPTPYVRRALDVARSEARDRAESDVLTVNTLDDGPPALALAPEGAATIPVPPPVPGGWLGTLAATALLALEVFLSLSRWLFATAKSAVVRSPRSARSGFPRFVGRVVRLGLFLVFLALLGAVTTLVAYFFLREPRGS
ncbi:MAG: protein kinase [Planctomycetota bacterium]|nr:protein kinase [Planctomycetota bacterium]